MTHIICTSCNALYTYGKTYHWNSSWWWLGHLHRNAANGGLRAADSIANIVKGLWCCMLSIYKNSEIWDFECEMIAVCMVHINYWTNAMCWTEPILMLACIAISRPSTEWPILLVKQWHQHKTVSVHIEWWCITITPLVINRVRYLTKLTGALTEAGANP